MQEASPPPPQAGGSGLLCFYGCLIGQKTTCMLALNGQWFEGGEGGGVVPGSLCLSHFFNRVL